MTLHASFSVLLNTGQDGLLNGSDLDMLDPEPRLERSFSMDDALRYRCASLALITHKMSCSFVLDSRHVSCDCMPRAKRNLCAYAMYAIVCALYECTEA